jgi:hypothetical protein
MIKLKRNLIAAALLLALVGFASQIVLGIATGTSSSCGPAGACTAPDRR